VQRPAGVLDPAAVQNYPWPAKTCNWQGVGAAFRSFVGLY
jgi:hypothetical protein